MGRNTITLFFSFFFFWGYFKNEIYTIGTSHLNVSIFFFYCDSRPNSKYIESEVGDNIFVFNKWIWWAQSNYK